MKSVILLLLCITSPAWGQIQIMDPAKEKILRSYIPTIADNTAIRAKINQALIYTEDEIPRVIQDQPLSGGQGVDFTIFRSVYQQVNGSSQPTNGGLDFPWGTPGGLHLASKNKVSNFRLLWLPPDPAGGVWPVVVYRGKLERTSRINMPSPTGWRWIFPADAMLVEVLLKKFSNGQWATFEVRSRLRQNDGWDFERWVPDVEFPAFAKVAEQRLRDTLHPRRAAFDRTAIAHVLPPIPNALAILREANFVPAMGTERITPTAEDDENLVPRDYAGHFLVDCRDCHRDTLRAVTIFQEREWYGNLAGSADGIHSFWPFAKSSIGKNNPELEPRMLAAGMVAYYDPAKHPSDVYQIIPEYSNEPLPNPRITNASGVGGNR